MFCCDQSWDFGGSWGLVYCSLHNPMAGYAPLCGTMPRIRTRTRQEMSQDSGSGELSKYKVLATVGFVASGDLKSVMVKFL